MGFIKLRDVKAKDIVDTVTVYFEDDLMINVDINKDNEACGIEIIRFENSQEKE